MNALVWSRLLKWGIPLCSISSSVIYCNCPVLTPPSVSVSLTQLGDWVYEKMLMARDSSRDETQKLHKKWLKHQAFMAELAQNKEWLDKIEKVSAAGRPSDVASQAHFLLQCRSVFVLFFWPFNFFFIVQLWYLLQILWYRVWLWPMSR